MCQVACVCVFIYCNIGQMRGIRITCIVRLKEPNTQFDFARRGEAEVRCGGCSWLATRVSGDVRQNSVTCELPRRSAFAVVVTSCVETVRAGTDDDSTLPEWLRPPPGAWPIYADGKAVWHMLLDVRPR